LKAGLAFAARWRSIGSAPMLPRPILAIVIAREENLSH
jgi:hypothetical protein